MTQLIHQDTHDWKQGPRWRVERQPAGTTDPELVRFRKAGRTTLLDQIARWDGNGWDPKRWAPRHPQVPHTLLAIVEHHMREMVR